jgi:uncharacterized RDD family membrane protein YckC
MALNCQDKPTVCYLNHKNKKERIVFKEFSNGKWADSFSQTIPSAYAISVHQTQKLGELIFVLKSYDMFRILKTLDGQTVYEKKYDDGFPRIALLFPSLIFVPQILNYMAPLILALILSSMMKKYRICDYPSEKSTIYFASLSRRVLSQLIDAIILVVPILLSVIVAFIINYFDDTAFSTLWGLWFALLGLFWLIVCFILFSIGEGLWGITPGKWLFKIRVLGVDLQPCGFGRALLRNLLKFVDGFFNFMVGVIIIALSENWQRVGDMAARTVVVDVSKRKLQETEILSGI